MSHPNRIIITAGDLERLQTVLDQHSGGRNSELAELLEQELARAEIREVAPPDVVTMNSTVIFDDEETGERREATLCYPHQADPAEGRVSILAPVGSALIGLSVGQSIQWRVPGGLRRYRIVSVRPPPSKAALSA